MYYRTKFSLYSSYVKQTCGPGDSIRIQTPYGWKPATYLSDSVQSRHGREIPMILEKQTASRVHTCTRIHVKTSRSLTIFFHCLAVTFRGQIMHVVQVYSATTAWNTEY